MEIIPRAGTELSDNVSDSKTICHCERERERERDITICQCQNHSLAVPHTTRAAGASAGSPTSYYQYFIFQRFSISEFGAARPCHLPGRTTWHYASPQVLQVSLVVSLSHVSFHLATQSFYSTTFGQRKTNKKHNTDFLRAITGSGSGQQDSKYKLDKPLYVRSL